MGSYGVVVSKGGSCVPTAATTATLQTPATPAATRSSPHALALTAASQWPGADWGTTCQVTRAERGGVSEEHEGGEGARPQAGQAALARMAAPGCLPCGTTHTHDAPPPPHVRMRRAISAALYSCLHL